MIGGKPAALTYAAIRERIGSQSTPQEDWFLRIQTNEHGFVDLALSARDDAIEDCLFDATRHVPAFRAYLHSPEPVLLLEHNGM